MGYIWDTNVSPNKKPYVTYPQHAHPLEQIIEWMITLQVWDKAEPYGSEVYFGQVMVTHHYMVGKNSTRWTHLWSTQMHYAWARSLWSNRIWYSTQPVSSRCQLDPQWMEGLWACAHCTTDPGSTTSYQANHNHTMKNQDRLIWMLCIPSERKHTNEEDPRVWNNTNPWEMI